MRRSPGELIRQVLEPLAAARGFSYDAEFLDPTPGRDAAPFHFLMCGARILLALTYSDEFPTTHRRTARRGARAVRWTLPHPAAAVSTIFLTQALAALLEEVVQRAGVPGDAAIHRECAQLVQQAYPLERALLQRLQECRAEYRVMDTHEVRDGIRVGAEIGTKYHMALLEPGGPWGSDPDDDPEALDAQERYASQYLRSHATLCALEIILGPEGFAAIADNLLWPGQLDPALLVHDAGDQLLWNYAAEPWAEYARLALE